MIRVLLIDDDLLVRIAIRQLFASHDKIRIVASTDKADNMERLIQRLRPDIILCDIKLVNENGLELAKDLLIQFPELKIIMITGKESYASAIEAIQMGIQGYVSKGLSSSMLSKAITAVYNGSHWYDPQLNHRVLPALIRDGRKSQVHELNSAELDIAIKIASGYEHNEVMKILNLTRRSFYRYLSIVYKKLNAENDVQLTLKLIEAGIIDKDADLNSK